jgi:hypothetical protein
MPAATTRPTTPVDTSASPIGWRRSTGEMFGILLDRPEDDDAWASVAAHLEALGPRRVVVLLDVVGRGRRAPRRHRRRGVEVERLADDPGDRAAQLQSLRAVVLPVGADPARRAAWLTELAARRIPAILDAPDELTGRVPPAMLATAAGVTPASVADPDARERVGVAMRRALVADRLAEAPTVSVLLATNRPERIAAALARITAQTLPDVQTVVAVHAPVTSGERARLEATTDRPVTLLDAADADTLGEVLARATEAADGVLVAKMDDDDHYAPEHLADLADALGYSDATLVGKGAEFVHLAEIDTTIRRFVTGVETANRNLAGGTLLLARDALVAAGGWRHEPRAVDQLLLDDVLAAGGTIHRTHGLGFVLERHGVGHTWDAPVDYFLQQAVRQWPGLALEAAGFTGP